MCSKDGRPLSAPSRLKSILRTQSSIFYIGDEDNGDPDMSIIRELKYRVETMNEKLNNMMRVVTKIKQAREKEEGGPYWLFWLLLGWLVGTIQT